MKKSYDLLIEHIQQIEGELLLTRRETETAKRETTQYRRQNATLQRQAKIIHTLNLGLFSLLDSEQIYALACESAVHQLG